MIRKIVVISIFIICLFSCEKESNVDYKINFQLSNNQVVTGDTVQLIMDWQNSEITSDLDIKIYPSANNSDYVVVEYISLNSENNIMIVIPKGITADSKIEVSHSNGATAIQSLYKIFHPLVYNVVPLSGKSGEVITITGYDFESCDDLKVRINTLICEIIEKNDSVITCYVPSGCGSGKISLLCWDSHTPIEFPGLILDIGTFEYSWNNSKKPLVKSYKFFDRNYSLIRDDESRVVKRIWTNVSDSWTNVDEYYNIYSYNQQGKLDTIFEYYWGQQMGFSTISSNSDNSIVLITTYNQDSTFNNMRDLFFHNGIITNEDIYATSNGISSNLQYRINKDTLRITTTYFDENHNPRRTDEKWYIVDNYNSGFPDIGVNGFNYLINDYSSYHTGILTYPLIESSYGTTKIRYNEYGQLLTWTNLSDFPTEIIYVSFEYEE